MKKLILLFSLWLSIPIQAQWVRQNSGTTENLMDVHCISADTVMVVGNNATILRTTNGGANWNAVSNPATGNLYKLKFTDNQTGYISGNNGTLLKTTDGGQSWQSINTGTTENLYALHCISTDTIFVAGSNGLLMKSVDGGTNWSNLNSGVTNDIVQIQFFNSGTGYFINGNRNNFPYFHDGILNKTIDNGNTWNTITMSNESHDNINFVNENEGYIGSLELFKTNDGCTNMQLIDFFGICILDIDVINSDYGINNTVWTCGMNYATCVCPNLITRTTINNNNIETTTCYYTILGEYREYEAYYAIDFADEVTGYVVGEGGLVRKNTTGVNAITKIENNLFSISPNPVRNLLQINFKQNIKDNIQYKITDIQGKTIIQTDVLPKNENIDVSKLSKGIYYLNLTDNKNNIYTQKFIKE